MDIKYNHIITLKLQILPMTHKPPPHLQLHGPIITTCTTATTSKLQLNTYTNNYNELTTTSTTATETITTTSASKYYLQVITSANVCN